MKSLSKTVSGASMIDPSHDPEHPAATDTSDDRALPQAPREGFELGAIDVSGERPAHGLSSDRSTRWLVGGLVGGSLVLAGLITLVRGDDDGPAARGDRIELQAALGDPIRASVLALESVRLEAITISTVRALAEGAAEAPKSTPRRPATRTEDGATPAATTPAAATSGGRSPATGRGTAAPTIDQLPPPPPEPAAPAAAADDATATPPSEPAPAEPRPTVDAPEPDEAADAPSGV